MQKIIFSVLISIFFISFDVSSATKGLDLTFSPNNHLNELNGAVYASFIDNSGTAWVSMERKIFRFNPYQGSGNKTSGPTTYPIPQVYHIFELQDSLIVATHDKGFYTLDRGKDEFVKVETRDFTQITGIMVISEMQFLATTIDGKIHTYTSHWDDEEELSLYRSSTSSCNQKGFSTCLDLLKLEVERGDASEFHFFVQENLKKNFYNFQKSASGVMWLKISDKNQIILQGEDRVKFEYQLPLDIEISSASFTEKQIILGSHRGLILIDQDSREIEILDESKSKIKSNFITSIFQQSSEIFWIGTYAGISFLTIDDMEVFDSESCALPSNDIGGIYIADNSAIFVTYGGISVTERIGSKIVCPAKQLERGSEKRLMNVYRLGELLVLGSQGDSITIHDEAVNYASATGIWLPKKLTGVASLGQDRYAVSSISDGLTIITLGDIIGSSINLKDSAPAWSPIKLSDDKILYIKNYKIQAHNLSNTQLEIALPSSFLSEEFQFLTMSDESNLILATTLDNKVIGYQMDDSQKEVNEVFQYELDAVGYSAITINSELIVAQDNGLSIINRETGTIRKRRLVSPSGRSFNFNFAAVSQLDDKHIILGSSEGAVLLSLESITHTRPPKLNFTSFSVNGEPIEIGAPLHQVEDITLPHDAYHFSAGFAVMDYVNPNRSSYQYKLEGLDENWIDSGHTPIATYTNLTPGKYTLKVIGANADGVWNNEGISIDLIVKSAPWATWWAYSLYATMALLGLALFKRHYDTVQLQIKALAISREMVEATEGSTETLYNRIKRFNELLQSRDNLFQSSLGDVLALSNKADQEGEPNLASEQLIRCTTFLHDRLISQRAETSYYLSELIHLAFDCYHESKLPTQPKYIALVDVNESMLSARSSVHFFALLVGIFEWLPDNYQNRQVVNTPVNVHTLELDESRLAVQVTLGHSLEIPSSLSNDRMLAPLLELTNLIIELDDANPTQFRLLVPGVT